MTRQPFATWTKASLGALFLLGFAAGLFMLVGAPGNDDTHITYWAAHALAHHGGILNYNGRWLEQSSSLSTVVVLAALHKLTGSSIPTLGYLVSALSAGLTVVLTGVLSRRMAPRTGYLPGLLAASTPAFVYWSASGMEAALTSLSALLCVVASDAVLRQVSWSSALSAVLAMLLFVTSRPENALLLPVWFLAAAPLVWLAGTRVRRPVAIGRMALLAGMAVTVTLAVFVFRKLTFEQWFPAPVLAKAGGLSWREGFAYLRASGEAIGVAHAAAYLAAVLVMVRLVLVRRGGVVPTLVLVLVVGELAFVLLSGGDWMGMARFLVPVVPLCVLLLAASLTAAPKGLAIAAFLALAGVGLHGTLQLSGRGTSRPGSVALATQRQLLERLQLAGEFDLVEIANGAHLRDLVLLEHLLPVLSRLDAKLERPVVLYSGQAGMVPYHVFTRHFGRAEFIDDFMLTDDRARSCLAPSELRPTRYGTRLGHKRFLEHAASFERACGLRRPDIVFSTAVRGWLKELLIAEGYVVVYHQTGRLRAPRGSQNPAGLSMEAFFAVDKRHAEELALEETHYRWSFDP